MTASCVYFATFSLGLNYCVPMKDLGPVEFFSARTSYTWRDFLSFMCRSAPSLFNYVFFVFHNSLGLFLSFELSRTLSNFRSLPLFHSRSLSSEACLSPFLR